MLLASGQHQSAKWFKMLSMFSIKLASEFFPSNCHLLIVPSFIFRVRIQSDNRIMFIHILESILSPSVLANRQTETNPLSAIYRQQQNSHSHCRHCWLKQQREKMHENAGESIFFRFSALFLVHLLDAIYFSFSKWTFSIRCMPYGCMYSRTIYRQTVVWTQHEHTDMRWQCLTKLSKIETFVHPLQMKRNPVSLGNLVWCGIASYSRSVYTIALAKQLKMNFSIISFGDCVNRKMFDALNWPHRVSGNDGCVNVSKNTIGTEGTSAQQQQQQRQQRQRKKVKSKTKTKRKNAII